MLTVPGMLLFIGKLHPLLVHIPIGLLCFAILLEILVRWKAQETFSKVLPLVWILAAVSSIFSAVSGYLLSQGDGYSSNLINLHKAGGIALAIIVTGCSLLYVVPFPFPKIVLQHVKTFFTVAASVLLILTGHWGGSLTHGSDYLTGYTALSEAADAPSKKRISGLDSADVFDDAVMPVLQSKCVSCHNGEKKKGELLLTSYESILAGGKTRPGVVPGNTATSEIFRRITLPGDHKEFMPSDGKKPLTESQVAILEWWIENGAHRNMTIADLKPDNRIKDIFNDFFQLGKAAILQYTAPPPAKENLVALLNGGFQVYAINETTNLLEIKYNGSAAKKPDLHVLAAVKEQLVWLQLPNCGITDEDLKIIGQLPNLYKLNLNRNKITDIGIKELDGLSKLEYLNLYGTEISNNGVSALAQLPALKNLYVWGTAVDTMGIETLVTPRKDLNIIYKAGR